MCVINTPYKALVVDFPVFKEAYRCQNDLAVAGGRLAGASVPSYDL